MDLRFRTHAFFGRIICEVFRSRQSGRDFSPACGDSYIAFIIKLRIFPAKTATRDLLSLNTGGLV